MSVRVVLVKQPGKVNSTYVNYTPPESVWTVFMVMKRYQRLGKVVIVALILSALATFFNFQENYPSIKMAESHSDSEISLSAITEKVIIDEQVSTTTVNRWSCLR